MSFSSDMKIIYHMLFTRGRGKDHAERLDNFYSGQAEGYDDFRKRLLKGRQEMMQAIPLPENGIWVDMGGGTGANLEFIAEKIPELKRVYLVDLAVSLLKIAENRFLKHEWNHVKALEGDATIFTPEEGFADVVTFSYSLTMIPDWFSAIDNALRILKPGGIIGVVDFYVSRKWTPEGFRRHGWIRRNYMPIHFGTDNVFLSPDHVPYLHKHFEPVEFQEHLAKIPYFPLMKAPYYIFVGKKPATKQNEKAEE
ncbi:MAG: class I SAM-dependent methyltransferase [Planctomycetia bacterium]|nr:class I SAM-dependent methyltransferase [Planctomycetia bacterium]